MMWKLLLFIFVLPRESQLQYSGTHQSEESECPVSACLYDVANKTVQSRYQHDLMLREYFYVKATDPGAVEATPFYWDGVFQEDLIKSEILLEYFGLARDELLTFNGTCDANKASTLRKKLRKISECVPTSATQLPERVKCDKNAIWRSMDGTCNNLKNPNWGARNIRYFWERPPTYDDDISTYRLKAGANVPLEEPRIIGNRIAKFDQRNSPDFGKEFYTGTQVPNVLSLLFGQELAHDMGLLVKSKMGACDDKGVRCCDAAYGRALSPKQQNSRCSAIMYPEDDPFFAAYNVTCQNIIHAQDTLPLGSGVGVSNKVNLATSFVDLHTIYGLSDDQSRKLRTGRNGCLALGDSNILMSGPMGYQTGDVRAPQTPWLTATHSIFARYHNDVAERLAKCNPKWNDDKLFNMSRRVTTAVYQHLIYNEYLPVYLGPDLPQKYNLTCKDKSKPCGCYDSSVDPSNHNEFSQAAFRICHSYIPDKVNYYNCDFKKIKSLYLSDTVDHATLLEGHFDEIFRGMVYDPIDLGRVGCGPEVRNKFQKNDCGFGIDLFSLDLFRGREFGLDSFIDYFEAYGNTTIECWQDLKPIFSAAHFNLLKQIYPDVRDIDLIVGNLLENKIFGIFGQIGGTIVAKQFARSKDGDRFFYSGDKNPNPFTPAQLCEINRMSFAHLICCVTNLKETPEESLFAMNEKTKMVKCKDLRPLNVSLFC